MECVSTYYELFYEILIIYILFKCLSIKIEIAKMYFIKHKRRAIMVI